MAFNLKEALVTLAPTLAAMLGGPFAGTAVTALETAMGLPQGAGTDGITKVVENGNMSPEMIGAIRAADQKHAEIMQQQNIDVLKMNTDFKIAVMKADVTDVISARTSAVTGGQEGNLFKLSILLLLVTLSPEIIILFSGLPKGLPDIITGRILGLLDSVALMVLGYWYGTSHGSAQKNELLAAAPPVGTTTK